MNAPRFRERAPWAGRVFLRGTARLARIRDECPMLTETIIQLRLPLR